MTQVTRRDFNRMAAASAVVDQSPSRSSEAETVSMVQVAFMYPTTTRMARSLSATGPAPHVNGPFGPVRRSAGGSEVQRRQVGEPLP